VVTDITRSKRREDNAHLLSELVDEVAMASSDAALMRCVGQRLAEYLTAQRVLFIEIDAEGKSATNLYMHGSAEGPNESRTLPLEMFHSAEFHSEFLQGRPIAIDETATDPRTAPFATSLREFGTGSLLCAPCVLAGCAHFVLGVDKTDAYRWRSDEIELVQELATRTWTHIERVRAEVRLRESEERLRLATQTSGYGFYDYDPVSNDVHWTAELAAIHGMNADDEITSEKIQNLIHSDDRERTMRAMLDSLEPDGSGDFVQEYRIVRVDTGEIRWLFNRGRTFFEGVGASRRAVRCTGVVGDVTSRRVAEETLRETGERLRLAQAAGGVGTWEWNATTDEANWSAEAWKLFEPGGSGGVTYERWLNMIHPDDRERVARAVSRALAGASYSDEFRVVHPGGEIVWLEARGRVELTGNCQVMRGTIRDVTERHDYEAALHAADRQKDEFMAMLAHELRNPLAALRNGIELLTRTLPAGADASELLAMLRRQTGQLNRLVDDLLDVSRITQGRIALREEEVEIAAIVAHAVETAEPLILGKHHVLDVVTQGGPFYVRGDRVRLVQALGNVLHNAAKYTDSGGTLRVDVYEQDGGVAISVTDNGAGITEDLMPHIFDPFVQSERTLDRAQGGLGLGLSIVRRLIEMHGGSIDARSSGAGTGSTFTIRLPRIAAPDLARGTGTSSVDIPRRRVLVVDDNADAADALGMLLRLDEHDVDVVYDATTAIEVAARTRPDVILLDIGLPQIDGYEVAKHLRSNPQLAKTRIVALSGYDPHESWEPETGELFDAYLIKPADPEALRPILAASEPRTESMF
jgi:PAS domain S-box-containing protein